MAFANVTEKEAFRMGFMSRCAAEGLEKAAAHERLKAAVQGIHDAPGNFYDSWMNSPKGTGAGSYMDKWYNPWTQNTDSLTPAGQGLSEGTMRSVGRGALLAAPAALAGAGVAAAAPALAIPASIIGAGGLGGFLAGGGAKTALGAVGTAALLPFGLMGAAGLAGGAGLGYLGAKFNEPDVNEDEIKAKELAQAYKVYTDRMKARRAYSQYRQSR